LFLYVFAEQLSTSFIPIYAKSLPGSWAPQALAVGLPITIFAGVIGVASPYGARLVGRFGARTVLVLGCVPAILGYLLTAQAGSVETFTLWRALSAVGYALITIACQSYLVEAGKTEPRGRNMAVFVLAAMTGAVCGTAIGAVLADRLGYRATFVISAALTALAGLLTIRTMDRLAGRRRAVRAASGKQAHLREALSNPRFLALLVFGAVPAKLVLTGFVFYIGPLFLSALDDTQPEIGRQMMLYSATMLLTIRAGAWVADRLGASSASITLAGATTGAGLLLALVLPPSLAMTLGIAVVGLSQGLASAPLLVVVPELCPAMAEQLGVATLYGYLRLGERLGSIVGPILAGVLVSAFGFVPAIAAIGGISLISAAAYWAMTGSRQRV
jgi:predicted MFS family arabinose efflux permease